MKSLLPILSAMLVLVAGPRSASFGAETQRDTDPLIPLPAGPFVEKGMTREAVLAAFGTPSALLHRNLWVYLDANPVNGRRRPPVPPTVAPPELDTLVIGFDQGRVVLIRLCRRHVVLELLDRNAG